jgi:hypothetical protein
MPVTLSHLLLLIPEPSFCPAQVPSLSTHFLASQPIDLIAVHNRRHTPCSAACISHLGAHHVIGRTTIPYSTHQLGTSLEHVLMLRSISSSPPVVVCSYTALHRKNTHLIAQTDSAPLPLPPRVALTVRNIARGSRYRRSGCFIHSFTQT